jgi:hypothetical protein
VSEDDYGRIVDRVVHGLTCEPSILLDPLAERMHAMATVERFEEAAELRDRADALATAIARQRRLDGLRRAGHVIVELDDGVVIELDGGRLADGRSGQLRLDVAHDMLPLPRCAADEVACVAAWLAKEAGRVRLIACDGTLASPLGRVPSFAPAESSAAREVATKVLVRARG